MLGNRKSATSNSKYSVHVTQTRAELNWTEQNTESSFLSLILENFSLIHKPPADLKRTSATLTKTPSYVIPYVWELRIQSWWHKGSQLEAASLLDKRYVRYDNSLVISAFKAHEYEPDIHSTSYKCQASNALGAIVSRDVVINAGK